MPRRKKQAVTATIDLQATWELHYVSYFLRVFKKLFNLKKAFTAELLEKELNYDAIQVQFGEEIAKIVEFLTGERDLGATSWEPALEEQMCKDAIHPNILKGTNFNSLEPEQRLQLLKIVVDLIRNSKDQELLEFGRNLKSKSLRFKAVGKDKDENKYWTFGSSRLFREFSKPNSKRFEPVCTTPSEWEGFILTLRPSPHKNEKELHKSLKHVWGKIKDHMQLAQLKMKGHLELSQMAVKEHFELKRHAEAIEALESNYENTKMTNNGKFAKKTKQSLNDGIVTPVLSNSHVLSNGPEQGMFVKKKKKNKPKIKTEEQNHFLKPSKPKAKLSRSDSSSSYSDGPATKKPKLQEDQKPKVIEQKNSDEDDISEELRRKIENDDPGIDLSIFKPPEKRKCVLELEKRKGKTWYEADDDASDEDLHAEEFAKNKDLPAKKKKKKKVKSPPPVIPESSPIITAPMPPFKSYVFSTALANRGAYEVIIKGKYNNIIAYHQAQKWPKPYLQRHVHCEPFVPEELKNDFSLYSSDNGLRHTYSEEEAKKPSKKKPQKRPRKKPQKKTQRKVSDASFSTPTPSPPLVDRQHERDSYSSGQDPLISKHESSSSDRDNENSDNELYVSKKNKVPVDASHIYDDDEDFLIKREQSIKSWNKQSKFDTSSDQYDDYDRLMHNNNRKSHNSQRLFSMKKSNHSPQKKQKNSKVPTKGQKKQTFSHPRPSPLNQPTSLSKMQRIPDQLSEDDDDDDEDDGDENSASSGNEEASGDPYKEDRCDQSMPRSPLEPEIEDAKSPTEQLMERHIQPMKNKTPETENQLDQVKEEDKVTLVPPQDKDTEQEATVISSIKGGSMPLKMPVSSNVLSGSPRNSPQLSPFASYRGRSATYPADIINPKPGQPVSPRKSAVNDRSPLEVETVKGHESTLLPPNNVIEISPLDGSNPSIARPASLHIGGKASPPQQSHPHLSTGDSQRQKSMHIPHMSPHQMEVSSVIQRPNPSPSSSVDNLCSPAIPMHQMQSPSIPVKPPSSSPIVIHDTVNGSTRSVSPTSPAIVNKSGVPHSIISPVITNHKSPPMSRNSPSVQPFSNVGFSCSAQRPGSPTQLNSSIQRMHASQQDHSVQAALYQRHRLPQLPASLKTGIRGTPTALDDEKRLPGMIYNQQGRAYQTLPLSLSKELDHRSRGFVQVSQESGHNFHGLSGHGSQETPRTMHATAHPVPESLKSHLAMQRSSVADSARSIHGITHDSEEQARTYLGMPHGVAEPSRSHHGLPRVAQNSPRSHMGVPSHSQDASRTILGLTQSAQEVARNILGSSQESARPHHSAPPSASESSRSHHSLPINAQDLSRAHHAFTHPVHEQSRYPPGMAHPFHLNRTLHESSHGRSLHDVGHAVRPGVHPHPFQQGFRSLSESAVGKSAPTQSLFQHPHGRDFPSPSTGTKGYQSAIMERAMIEHQQQARLLEHQQQQSKKSFSVESLTASSDANERSKGQCLNGQPNSVSALSRVGYAAQQRSHMFGHLPGYTRGPSSEFHKLPPHVQQLYASRGLSPYMNYPHFKG